MSARIDAFLSMLQQGRDSSLLRFALGNEYLLADEPAKAAEHFRKATEFDGDYSAAWKLLGKSLAESGEPDAAIDAYTAGIAAANKKGDLQAAKEMTVFLRRLQKQESYRGE